MMTRIRIALHSHLTCQTQMMKWHPGDIVRVELDLDAGTISFAVNGISQGIAFTGVSGQGEIFPACTFYGTANTNQLIMEIMGVQLPSASFTPPDSPLRKKLTEKTKTNVSVIEKH